MKINSITLENYRNIKELSVDFDDVNIIWGENAQGKTNLLEAIYLFSGAKSFRGAKDKELVKFDCDYAKMKLDFFANGREQTAEISIKDRKTVTLNGIKKRSSAELGDEIKTIIFSPDHLNMIKEGPNERRKFIDGALCQIKSNYRTLLKNYSRTLVQRNSLLRNVESVEAVAPMLEVWDVNLSNLGAKIIYQRIMYLKTIKPYLKDIFEGISGGKEDIELVYIGAETYKDDVNDIEQRLYNKIRSHRKIDVLNHTTTKGPHRDDIEIMINGRSVKSFGSQGQQRSSVLALKLAEASLLREMTGENPIALLDDVMSELDEKRQDYILNHIKDLQVFITCCDKETVLRLKKGKTFHIANGALSEG
ncbi:DNA replication/repair protein RecF [uncultured Eubacterium sp.]|uniref:DNA replication/repair protein RecF n=1 Tax=uncultured Eubacterium sp. TaxID=165185 RepID=UPI0025F3A2DC|nr:DNA replication/repair protein RecF [uncultured Eubacterium sp.]